MKVLHSKSKRQAPMQALTVNQQANRMIAIELFARSSHTQRSATARALGTRYRTMLTNCRHSSTDCCTTIAFRRRVLQDATGAVQMVGVRTGLSAVLWCAGRCLLWVLATRRTWQQSSTGGVCRCIPDCPSLVSPPDGREPPPANHQKDGEVQAGCCQVPYLQPGLDIH